MTIRGRLGKKVRQKVLQKEIKAILQKLLTKADHPSTQKYYEQYLSIVNWFPHDLTAADWPYIGNQSEQGLSQQPSVHTILGTELTHLLCEWWGYKACKLPADMKPDKLMREKIDKVRELVDDYDNLGNRIAGDIKHGYYFDTGKS